MAPSHRTPARARAFTLIEVVVVLLVFSVIVAMAAVITRGVSAAQKRSLTATRIALVDAALVQFVMQRKRLPCPADGTLASSNNNAGIEANWNAATGCTSQTNGVVPWRALALTETEASDGWDRRLTYRIQPALAATGAMDMSWCDPAGTGPAVTVGGVPNQCNTGCTSTALSSCTSPANFLAGKGLQVRNIAGTILMDPAAAPHTGAGYVVVSHGETGGGAYLYSGVLATSTVTDGTEEARNYANQAYVAGTSYYVDDAINDASGATHFDDLVSRPSLLGVITRAGLGPRSH